MIKKLFLCASFLLVQTYLVAQTVTLNNYGGWLESAFITWQPVVGAESYNVYYSGEGVLNQKIDNSLIRGYNTYLRADILGLKAGSYTITVKSVTLGVEDLGTTTPQPVTVLAQDRSGFAFANGRVPGGYTMDGTPKPNAVILYITEATKNTVSLNVTGATSNPCIGLQTILDGFKKGNDTRPLIIRLVGQITDPSYTLNGDIVIENKQNASSHITFEGVGDDAVADGWGIRIKNATNIEIRNIGTMNCNSGEGDNIGLQQDNDYIWVHNVDFFYGDAGGDADQAKGDGALDCKRSTYVTFSYNHFWDSGKSNLLGLSENTTSGLYITYHHNWYDHSDSRHPRVRFYSAHVYNNYYDGNSKYGVGATEGASVFVENNYFRNCKYPMLTSMQGSDVYNASTGTNDYNNNPTFSKEDGGTIKAFNNYMIGETRFVPYGHVSYPNPSVDFDAYVATSRNETLSASVVSAYGSNTYNNFDTNASVMYSYTPDSPEDAKTKVMQYSGRMQGGDFEWTFNQPGDDTSYAVNQPLKTALSNYTTTLVYVQGETPPSTQTLSSTNNTSQTVVEGTPIEAIVFTWGGDATDATVTGLPASGITFVKDATAKTITITGTPTATVSYTIATSGATGTPVTDSGTITLGTTTAGDEIHNFTTSGKTSTFYAITGNLSTSKGTANYNGLVLTQCLKMESTTNISFTTAQQGVLTLVLNDNYTGDLKINGTTYNAVAGIITLPIAAGNYAITKGSVSTTNLYYMKVAYDTAGVHNVKDVQVKLYPNPVFNTLHLTSMLNVEKVEIYTILGVKVLTVKGTSESIDMGHLSRGSYVVKVFTNKGTLDKIIIKK